MSAEDCGPKFCCSEPGSSPTPSVLDEEGEQQQQQQQDEIDDGGHTVGTDSDVVDDTMDSNLTSPGKRWNKGNTAQRIGQSTNFVGGCDLPNRL